MKRIRLVMLCVLWFAPSAAFGQLTQAQFVEAVTALGLGADCLAAAGVSEQNTSSLWGEIADDDAAYAQYVAAQSQVRTVLDVLSNQSDSDQMQSIAQAQDALAQLLDSWRDEVCSHLPAPQLGRVQKIVSQQSLAVPAYLWVVDWTAAEQTSLRRGHTQRLRNQRIGGDVSSNSLQFYDNAMALGDVVAAKAQWEVRHADYAQRFSNVLSTLSQE